MFFNFGGNNRPPPQSNDTEYYDTLGISKTATEREIKKAYRKMALQHHPDKNKGNAAAQEKFQKINEAYEVLSNTEKKEKYDKFGKVGINNEHGGMNPHDIFSNFFGRNMNMRQNTPRNTKVKPTYHTLNVTLEEMYNGNKKQLKITRKRICKKCNGVGGPKEAIHKCLRCNGQGQINIRRQIGPGMIQQMCKQCDICKGTGKTMNPRLVCKECKGNKTIQEAKICSVYIDAGSADGSSVKLYQEGNEEPGCIAGDIIFKLKQKPHNIFKRNGNNLHILKKISLIDALCSYNFAFTHLDQRIIYVKQPSNDSIICPNTVRCVKGEGMTILNSSNKGNLIIHFSIEFPKKLSSKFKSILKNVLPDKTNIEKPLHSYELNSTKYDPSIDPHHIKSTNNQNDNDENAQQQQCAQQ